MPLQKWPPWSQHLEDTITEALASKLVLAGGMNEYRKLARDVAEAVHREGYRLETGNEAEPEVQKDGTASDQGTEGSAAGREAGSTTETKNDQAYPSRARFDDWIDY